MSYVTRFYDDINQYYELVYPFLLKREVENGLPLSLIDTLKKDIERYGEDPPVLCTVNRDDNIILISLRTPPYNQILSYTEDLEAIDILIKKLNRKYSEIPGVLGFKEGAERFAKLWCEIKAVKFKLAMNERLYKLTHVAEETLGKHQFIKATDLYEDIVLRWGMEFMLEALPERDSEINERSLENRKEDIKEGRIFLLIDNDEPVSMARKAGKTPNGIAVNLVYTPPKLRRKGYATECVAKLSKLLLEEGNNYCFLFTDLSNPTSNSIYQKIGYQAVMDVDEYHFIS
jgi:RimJ/RimL family protein N-acetyltransferase